MCRNRGTSSEVSVASLSPRAPAAPASAETARFLPHPDSPEPSVGVQGGHAARKEVCPGLSAVRSGLTATPHLGHLSASSISLETPLHPAPHHPASVPDQEGPETGGGRCASGILESPQRLARQSSSLRGMKGPSGGGGTQAFVSWRGYLGTKTPALWQAGGRHRGLHAGRLQSTGNHPLPQSWGPHV